MSKHWDYKYFDYFINQEYIEYKDSDDYSLKSGKNLIYTYGFGAKQSGISAGSLIFTGKKLDKKTLKIIKKK